MIKRNNGIKPILIILFSWVMSPSALAIELSELVADSISAHPEVKGKIHIYRQVLSDQSIADSGWRPSVDLQASTGFFVNRVSGNR